MNALAKLEPFVRAWRAVAPPQEHCGVCRQAIDDEQHEHLIDLEKRALLCSCSTCATLFAQEGTAPVARYRVVPKRVLVDPNFQMDDAQWAALAVPVRLAFVFFNSRLAA